MRAKSKKFYDTEIRRPMTKCSRLFMGSSAATEKSFYRLILQGSFVNFKAIDI
jgi:hypothetical protein